VETYSEIPFPQDYLGLSRVETHSETPFPQDYLGLSRVETHFRRIVWDYLEWKPISAGLSGII
jgi:hypothetical protein